MVDQNAITLLKADHAKVKQLFEQWETAEPDQQAAISEMVFHELEVHADLEEQLFYPAMREKADEQDSELLDEALKEHKQVKEAIAKLRGLPAEDEEAFQSLFEELMDDVSHHVEEEESEMLPRAEKKLGARLTELGGEMQKRKQRVTASH